MSPLSDCGSFIWPIAKRRLMKAAPMSCSSLCKRRKALMLQAKKFGVELVCVLAFCPVLFLPPSIGAQTTSSLNAIQMARDSGPSVTRKLGTARMTYWGFNVYDAELWVDSSFRAQEWRRWPFVLELRYLRAFKGQDIARRSIDEMRRQRSFSEELAQRWLDDMTLAFGDIQAGDRLSGVYLPDKSIRFYANGVFKREIADPEFARLFMGIWLSDLTSEPKMRQALLGLD
ncbi:MAG: hypothetical protein EB072_03210 [Betaproteobacteria bacterium]|nr:hypothetical protein [Betaproteobacteria bacterium]